MAATDAPSRRLLPPVPASLAKGLADLPVALAVALPLRPKHRAQLPAQVAQLSEWLTTARDELPRDYLSRPALLAAYLHYFLPWNLCRQGRLLAGLDLQLAPGAQVVDIGAGPFTFALALWLTRPDLRAVPLRYLAIDRAGAALEAGKRLWDAVAPGAAWTVEWSARPAGSQAPPAADLLVLANVLNEVHRGSGESSDPEGDPADRLLERWRASLAPGGRVLLIEPGTRPAARRLVSLRERALETGWTVVAPCPHAGRCPQPGTGHQPWCHFAFDAAGTPPWLADLSRRAGLAKERASLSFLLLEPRTEDPTGGGPAADTADAADTAAGNDGNDVLVVSGTFPLPGGARGRYGCSGRGLVLLEEPKPGPALGPGPGDLVRVVWPEHAHRDAHSGATIAPLPTGAGRARPRSRPRWG
jgi:hypothetical protein